VTEKADLTSTDVTGVLERAAAGERISPAEALALYRFAPLHALGAAADAVRRRRYAGIEHIATYIIERNINYTNVCLTACKFCAFYAPPKIEKGWSRELDDILRRCAETGEAYLPEQVEAVVQTQLEYLRAIGAMSTPAEPPAFDPPGVDEN